MRRFLAAVIWMGASIGVATLSAQQPHPAALDAKVDATVLKNAGTPNDALPGSWLSYGRSLSETRYSPLNQINTSNVNRLGLAWTYALGAGGLQAVDHKFFQPELEKPGSKAEVGDFHAAAGEVLQTGDDLAFQHLLEPRAAHDDQGGERQHQQVFYQVERDAKRFGYFPARRQPLRKSRRLMKTMVAPNFRSARAELRLSATRPHQPARKSETAHWWWVSALRSIDRAIR